MAKENTQIINTQETLADTSAESNAALDGVTYSLSFLNNSTQTGFACIYQQDPNITDPDVMSLAWFSKGSYPETKITFAWQINYNFVWAQAGLLVPGVIFTASESPAADLSTTNQITLLYDQDLSSYTFDKQESGAESGTLYITEDSSIPSKSIDPAAVGIGMAGFGTFVKQATPNWNLNFTPKPEYWITFGNYCQGEVMDISSISNSAQISFPPGVYSMAAVLNADNTWTVSPASQASKAFAAVSGSKPLLNGKS
jgi:hypothetical protein